MVELAHPPSIASVKRRPDVARTWRDQARVESFRGDMAIIRWRGLDGQRLIFAADLNRGASAETPPARRTYSRTTTAR
ncbi:MAG: DUF3459 domain-containing protein [Rhizobiales bacterium]|nr:DUF3459 domain-containing protein [Hyphomicrobiales bacterium]